MQAPSAGRLFSAEFNARKVVAYALKPHGATYLAEPADFITTDDPQVAKAVDVVPKARDLASAISHR